MSRHHRPQHRGADREARDRRRQAAQARDDATTPDRARPRPTEPERDCE